MSLAPSLELPNQLHGTRHSVQMAPWSHIIISKSRIDQLCPYIFSFLTVAASTEGRSPTKSTSPTHPRGHDPKSSSQHLQQSISSIFSHVSNISRQSHVCKIAGQIRFWDMVHLVMACGLIQLVRMWKRRRQTRQDGFVPSSDPVVEGSHGREHARASLDDNEKPRKGEWEYLVKHE